MGGVPRCLGARAAVKLREDVAYVYAHGFLGDSQCVGDLAVRGSLRDFAKHHVLARGEQRSLVFRFTIVGEFRRNQRWKSDQNEQS